MVVASSRMHCVERLAGGSTATLKRQMLFQRRQSDYSSCIPASSDHFFHILLPFQCNLTCHHPLTVCDQLTVAAFAELKPAVLFVSLKNEKRKNYYFSPRERLCSTGVEMSLSVSLSGHFWLVNSLQQLIIFFQVP